MRNLFAIVAAALFAVGLFAPASVMTGCKSSPAAVAYKAGDAMITTVDAGMKAWADYVVAERARIAKLPAADRLEPSRVLLQKEGKVSVAYGRYQDALRAAHVGVTAALASGGPIPPEVTGAASALLEVLRIVKG